MHQAQSFLGIKPRKIECGRKKKKKGENKDVTQKFTTRVV
jgi:hypothetical protein